MPPCVVDAIPGTNIDAKFADAITNCLGIAQIALAHGVQTRKNSGLGANITQTCQPLCEKLSLLDLEHDYIVSPRIRLSMLRRRGCGRPTKL